MSWKHQQTLSACAFQPFFCTMDPSLWDTGALRGLLVNQIRLRRWLSLEKQERGRTGQTNTNTRVLIYEIESLFASDAHL